MGSVQWSSITSSRGGTAFPPTLSIINPMDMVFCRLFPSPIDGYSLQPSQQDCNTEKTGRGPTGCCWNLQSCDIFFYFCMFLRYSFSFPFTVSSPSFYLFSALFPAILNGSWINKSCNYNSDPAQKKYLHIYLLFWLCLLAEARWNPQVSWCDSVVVSHQVLCYKITLKWETELSKASFLRSDFAFISHQSCQ